MALPLITSITSQTPFQSTTNINQSHLLKLDCHNYIVWKSQILPVLRGHELEGYVDGTHTCPPKVILNSSSKQPQVARLSSSVQFMDQTRPTFIKLDSLHPQ